MSNGLIDSINRRTQLAGYNRLALLLFRLGGPELFGINVFKVQEVVQAPELTWVPAAHSHVRGVAPVRGRMIPVLDLASAVQGTQPADEPRYLIVAEFNRRVQGFLVHGVERIVNVDVGQVTPPPASAGDDGYLTAVTRLGERLIQIIDVEKVLADVIGLAADLEELPEHATDARRRKWRVLVADDSKVARMQIARTLEQLNLEPVLVNDGREALRFLRSQAETGQEDDLLMVISDVEMPDMDGYTLTTEIRRDPRLEHHYVLLHTSLSGLFNHSMVEHVGADRFVPKFNSDELAKGVVERLRDKELALPDVAMA
ncbi:MAG: chemotaxis protein [Abyssibacter sp.]|nr:chemotaxis protein [Pseudomonadota bacterium]